MNQAKFVYDKEFYRYCGGTSSEMDVLSIFLSNIGCSQDRKLLFKNWALADKNDPNSGFTHTCSTNATLLDEYDNGDIHIIDDTGSDPDDVDYIPAKIIMTREQFVQLLDDWAEKVCKLKPKEVIIKYDNNQFVIETNS